MVHSGDLLDRCKLELRPTCTSPGCIMFKLFNYSSYERVNLSTAHYTVFHCWIALRHCCSSKANKLLQVCFNGRWCERERKKIPQVYRLHGRGRDGTHSHRDVMFRSSHVKGEPPCCSCVLKKNLEETSQSN